MKSPDELARKIADLDDSFILVALISELGEILGFHVSEAYRSILPLDRKKFANLATRSAISYGAAMATSDDGLVSETEGIVVIRRSDIHYYTRVQGEKPVLVAVWFQKDANVTAMSNKIRGLFGL